MPEDYGDHDPREPIAGGSTTRRILYALCAIAILMIIAYMAFLFGLQTAAACRAHWRLRS